MSLTVYQPGDWVVFDGATFDRVENSDPMELVIIQSVVGELLFRGFWDASKNEPKLEAGRSLVGDFYVVSVGGAVDLTYPEPEEEEEEEEEEEIGEVTSWSTGDWALHDGDEWIKLKNSNPIDIALIPEGIEEIYFRGLWDPTENNPILSHSSGTQGHFYVVSVPGVFIIPEEVEEDPEAADPLPPVPVPPPGSDGEFGYLGKFTLANIVPGFDESLNKFIKNIDDFVGPAIDAKKSALQVAQKKVGIVQNALQASSNATQEAQNLLQNAETLLNEAKNLTTNLKRALERAGLYSYYYVGPIGNFGTRAQTALSSGLPGSTAEEDGAPAWGPDERVAVKVIIAGSDGGTVQAIGRVTDLFNIVGGNAQSAVTAFQNILPD